MNVKDFAESYLRPYKEHNDEIVAMHCPFCGNDSKDKWKFYLNRTKKTFICHRGKCGRKGHFTELCKEFGQVADREEEYYAARPSYKKPRPEKLPQYTALDRVENYLQSRGISKKTWERRKIGESQGAIAMPYYENGEVVLVKFRLPYPPKDGEPKSWMSEGGKPVLWGMELCDKKYPLVIVEGEIDALSLDECDVPNVLSVPIGAGNLNWIENCWDFMTQYKEIVFWVDNDAAGKKMLAECQRRLSDWKLRSVKSEHKDANDALRASKDKVTLALMVEMAPPLPISGVIDLAEIDESDDENIVRVCSGMGKLDKNIGGFALGEVTVWTGKPGEGKSTFIGQTLLNAVKHGHKVCAYSGELRAKQFRYWLYLQAAGPDNITEVEDNKTGFKYYRVNYDAMTRIREWHRGRLYLYDNRNDQAIKESQILPVFRRSANQYGCDVFLIDNMMTAQFEYGRERDYYQAQGDFFREISAFAQAHNVHVHVVAHPRKTQGKEIDGDDIAGTKVLVNLAQNVISVERGKSINTCEIKVIKNRETGLKDKIITYLFDPKCKQFNDSVLPITFGWEPIKPQAKSVFDEMGASV